VDPGADLAEAVTRLRSHGLSAQTKEDVTPALGRVAELQDPRGTAVQLFTEARRSTLTGAPQGVVPLKLGHVAFMVPSAQAMVDFYTGVLGSGYRTGCWTSSPSCGAARTITPSIS
jgi:hypothetical protein